MKSLLKSTLEIFYKPAETVSATMHQRRWLFNLILIMLITAITLTVLVDFNRLEDSTQLSDSQLEMFRLYGSSLKKIMILFSLLMILFTYLIGAFFLYLFYKLGNTEGLFVHYFSGFLQASLIDAGLGNILKLLFFLFIGNATTFLQPTLLAPNLNANHFFFHVLAMFDPLSLWSLIALALGIAKFSGISIHKSIRIAIIYFSFKLITLAPIFYVLARFSRQ